MPQVLTDLAAQVKENVDAEASAVVVMNGFQSRLDAAVAAALQNGATAAELAPITDEIASMKASKEALAAAIVANTPAA